MSKQQHFKIKINVFTTDNQGRSGLIMACLFGHNKMVEYLLENAYDEKSLKNLLTNKKNNQNALHYCAESGNDEAIDKLFAFCPDVCKTLRNVGDQDGDTPFFNACYYNKLECAKKLITLKNVNMRDKNGWSPFSGAIRQGNDKITNFLCNSEEFEVDISKEDLDLAVEKGDLRILCQILSKEIKINNIFDISGLKKDSILSLSMVDEWLNVCLSNNNLGLYSFLTKLKEFGLKKENKFSYIKTLLNINREKIKNDVSGEDEKMRKGNAY